MIALLQRVTSASVTVDDEIIGQIESGLLVLMGVEPNDNSEVADRMLERLLNYRVFSDEEGKMNLSLRDTGGNMLLVPQFTLAANTQKGNRPSFTTAAPPELGKQLYQYSQEKLTGLIDAPQFGQFGADMKVALTNDGPVTFWLQFSSK